MTPEQKQLAKLKKEVKSWSSSKKAEAMLKLRLIKFNDWTLQNEILARALGVPAPESKWSGAHYWACLSDGPSEPK